MAVTSLGISFYSRKAFGALRVACSLGATLYDPR